MRNEVIFGDALSVLKTLPDELVRVCVTSPPYWGGQRDYDGHRQWFDEPATTCDHNKDIEHGPHHPGQVEETKWRTAEGAGKGQNALTYSCTKCGAWYGQLGQEPTVEGYIRHLTDIFREVRRVLTKDGSFWLNIGDVYKDKRLQLVPYQVALALQTDGWILRSTVQWCLSGGAWVYARMQKGDMPIMIKDLMRRAPSTVQLWNGTQWTQVLGWGKSTDTSEKLELVLRSGERIGCTGGHQWPTQRGLVAARDLILGDVLETCSLPDNQDPLPGYLTKDVLWLLGLYLAEGSRSQRCCQLSLNVDEIQWLPRIELAAKHLGSTVTHTVDGNSLHVRIYGGLTDAVISGHIGGKTAHTKHLKVVCWRYSNQALRLIMEGYLDGDGSLDAENNRWRIGFCRNYHWERDLRVLAARLGATLTLTPTIVTYQLGSKPAFKGEWRWERSGHHREKDRGEVVEIRLSRAREFWDISVSDEPHLFSLASGVLTHNCKPNAKPESVKDRPVRSHEPIFQLCKSEKSYYDHEAVREVTTDGNDERSMRDVWSIPYEPLARVKYKREANFAVFPTEIPRRCILASSRKGDLVLDPFAGSGTTLGVAKRLGRDYLGIEANASYSELIERRIDDLGGSVPMEDVIEGLTTD